MYNHVPTTKTYEKLSLQELHDKLLKEIKSKCKGYSHPVEFVQNVYKSGASRHQMMILELLVRNSSVDHIGKLLLFPPNVLHKKYIDLLCFMQRFKSERFIDRFSRIFNKNQ